jgi:short-subunit dehydrogenase
MSILRLRRDLRGAAIVVVGATSGIGRAAAIGLAGHGCRLVLAARDPADLHAVAEECRRAGAATVTVCPTDTAVAADVDRLRRQVRADLGAVDAWVNTAAVLLAGDLVACPPEDLHRIVATNVLGTMLTSRAALATFDEQGRGTLVNVSSLLGVVPNPLVPAYVASKFAVRGMTLALQQAPRPRAIKVCLVVPGPIDTPMFTTAGNHTGHPLRAIPPAISSWRAAAAVVSCIRRPRRTMTTGLTGWALLIGHRFVPRQVEWGVAKFSGQFVTRSGHTPPTSGAMHAPIVPGAPSGGFRRSAWRRRIGDRLGRWSLSRP